MATKKALITGIIGLDGSYLKEKVNADLRYYSGLSDLGI
jgi:GDP-D-mannose dehydratase